ncbi:MAG: DUF1611 domain-containing protein [Pseudomonadota bacterium]
MKEQEAAIILAPGLLTTPHAKVTHGLLRRSARFEICAVVDADNTGRDAGELLDGEPRDIPVFASVEDALEHSREKGKSVQWCVVGIATHGGRLTDELRVMLKQAAESGIGLVNGLHDLACDDPGIAAAANAGGVEIVDLRKPRGIDELHFWTGEIRNVKAPRIAVIGTDCALGKRTTTRLLTDALNNAGVHAEMIYTGQTGWMQGGQFGFILDSTLNDFVSGELEHAVLKCERAISPDVMLLEGQSALRNPSGPCGAELLVSTQARGVILQHAPGRPYFEGYEEEQFAIPSIQSEIELIGHYGARVIAVTLNGEGMSDSELQSEKARLADLLKLPVICPLLDNVDELTAPVREFLLEQTA